MNLKQIRAQYPQYDDLSDEQLASALHRKFYSDLPRDVFDQRIGFSAAPKERTAGEAFTDVGAGLVKGVGNLVQLPGQLYGLATGDFSDTGVLGAGKRIEEYGESLKSQGLKEREAARQRAVQAAAEDGQIEAFKTSFMETVKDPALLSSFVSEQLPQLLPIILSGGTAAALTAGRASAAALAKGATKEAAAKAAQAAALRAGTTAAVQTGAVMQGTDVGTSTYDAIYQNVLQRTNDPQQAAEAALNRARMAGVAGYGLSVLANKYLPGGKALEEALLSRASGRGLLAAGAAGALKEIPSENVEELGGALARNIALRDVDPTQTLTQGLGETAAQATLGAAVLGGAAGAYSGRGPAPVPAPAPQKQPEPTAEQTPQDEFATTDDADEGPATLGQIESVENLAARLEARGDTATAKDLREQAAAARAKVEREQANTQAEATVASLDTMDYESMAKARAALEAAPKTAKTTSAINAITARMRAQDAQRIEAARRGEALAQESAFGAAEPDLFGRVYPPAPEPEAVPAVEEPQLRVQDPRQMDLLEPLRAPATPEGAIAQAQPDLFGMVYPPAPEPQAEVEPQTPPRPDLRADALQMPLDLRARRERRVTVPEPQGAQDVAATEQPAAEPAGGGIRPEQPADTGTAEPGMAAPVEFAGQPDAPDTAGAVAPERAGVAPVPRDVGGYAEPAGPDATAVTPEAPVGEAPVEEAPVEEAPDAPAIAALKAAKTRAEAERAMDTLVAIQQDPANPDQELVADFIAKSLRIPGFEVALRQAEGRARAKRQPTSTGTTPQRTARAQKRAPEAIPEGQLFPAPPDYERRMAQEETRRRVERREAELKAAWAQVPDVRRAKEAQADLFSSLVAEEPTPAPEVTQAPATPRRLPTPTNFTSVPTGRIGEMRAVSAGPRFTATDVLQRASAPEPEVTLPEWAASRAENYRAVPIPVAPDLVLLRGFNTFGGFVYLAATPTATTRVDIEQFTGKLFSDQQLAQLEAAKTADKAEQDSKAAQFPDGPFTGASQRVVGSATVQKELVQYATELLSKVGLGKVRVFLVHPSDVDTGVQAQQQYNLYGDYAAVMTAGMSPNESGSMRLFGRNRKDAYISIDPTLGTAAAIETLAHEIGHLIEKATYADAPKETKAAIQAEYRQWAMRARQGTVRELVESLRNQESAARVQMADPDAPATILTAYWTSFGEWFADNVSKWATTDEQAISVVEKFFAELGAKLRKLVAAVLGTKWAPAKSVADFLNAMGPDSADAWLQSTAQTPDALTKAQQVSAVTQRANVVADVDRRLAALDRAPVTEPTRMQQATAALRDAKENPRAAAQTFNSATSRFLDTIGNKLFSSNFAFTRAIRKQLEGQIRENPQAMGMLLSITDAQADASAIVAGLHLKNGRTVYNPELYKLESKDGTSMYDVGTSISEMAKKHGLTPERANRVVHTFFEARRTKDLLKRNADLESDAQALEAAGYKKKAADFRAKIVKGLESEAWVDAALQFEQMFPELTKIADQWNEVRKNTSELMVASGLWTPEEAENLLEAATYAPFFREGQIEEGKGPKEYISGFRVAAKEKRLKGSDREIADIFDNMVRWTQFAVERAVRNHMAVVRADAAVQFGLGEQVSIDAKDVPNPVKIWRDGKQEQYSMRDPLFADSFQGLESVALPVLGVFSKFTNLLRQSVVLNPLFGALQVPQDALAAIYTSGLRPRYAFTIPARAVKEFLHTLVSPDTNKVHQELRRFGAVGAQDVTANVIRTDLDIMEGAKAAGALPQRIGRTVLKGLHHVAMASDAAVRQAVYQASLDQGLSQAEALEKSFQLINFRNHGTSKTLTLAARVIPFLNAYMAAQHVAYKTLSGTGISPTDRKAALETLAYTTAGMMTLAVLYAMLNGDDEGYEKHPLYRRDRVFVIPGTGGMAIPMRSDVFAFPKVFAEHMWHHITDSGTLDGANTRRSMKDLAVNAIAAPHLPQFLKPAVEVAINYDFFRNRPLVGSNLADAATEYQYVDSTSELAKSVGRTGLISPIAFDHLMRGYLGSLGGLTLYMTNAMGNSLNGTPRPDMDSWDAIASFPGAGLLLPKSTDSAMRADFYELKEATDRVVRTVSALNGRNPQELERYLAGEDVMNRAALAPAVNAVYRDILEIRKAISQVRNNTQLSGADKQARIKELQEIELQIYQSIGLREMRRAANL